jgi:hypothetical protein
VNSATRTLEEYRTLVDLQANTPKEELPALRTKIKASIRRMVSQMFVLVVPRGRDRLAAVQLWFAEGHHHRDYLVLYRPPKRRQNHSEPQPGKWWVTSLAEVSAPGDLDLRRQEDVLKVEAVLEEIDPPGPRPVESPKG